MTHLLVRLEQSRSWFVVIISYCVCVEASGNPQWISCSNGNHPNNAVECGTGSDRKTKLYVARARQGNALVPGKLHPKYKTCYIPNRGREHSIKNYEVLVAPPGSLHWVNSSHGALVANAVVGGRTESGEDLYIGRCIHAGLLTCGKILPSHAACYVPYDGKEFGYNSYQILVRSFIQPQVVGFKYS